MNGASSCPPAHDLGLFLIRAMLGVVFLFHGSQKLFGIFDGHGLEAFADALGKMHVPVPKVSAALAALAEFLGGIALLTGLWFRPMMVPLCCTMLVAAFWAHGDKGFDMGKGGMEYPLTLAVVVFALILTGPGRIALAASGRRRDGLS
jgi:putative oxidoreductase